MKVKKQYQVYHMLMRDTQIYIGDTLSEDIDPYDISNQDNWKDYKGDILLDIVLAEDENSAIRQVSKEENIHESNLYAIEHVVNAKDVLNVIGRELPYCFEASSYNDSNMCGIEIVLPNNQVAYVILDKADNELKFIYGSSMSKEKEIINLQKS